MVSDVIDEMFHTIFALPHKIAYDSPRRPKGPARVIQAVSWSSLQKGSLISRNGYVCRWMGTLTDENGSLSAVVISTVTGKSERKIHGSFCSFIKI